MGGLMNITFLKNPTDTSKIKSCILYKFNGGKHMDLDYRALGTNIRGHRKKRDMTQADLAEAVGVSDSHIGKIETGRGIPSLATVAAIANSLEVGLDTLLHGDIHYKTDFCKCQAKFPPPNIN
jgi:DNA-binding XRE family transcriptional regulator